MKARLTVLLLLLFIFNSIAFSQLRCGFDEIHARRMKTDPVYRARVTETEKSIQKYLRKNKQRLSARVMGTEAALYTIPVVVHVIHTGGAIGTIYNPTDAQIQGAINYLNQIYNGSYPGTEGVGDVQLQFALAVRGPNCSSTTGIDRVDGSILPSYASYGVKLTGTNGEDEVSVKDLSRWNTNDYYNIWVVNKIDGKDGTTSGPYVGGYAYLPGAPKRIDGTVMLATQMSAGKKTMPHEIGHAFGLYHPFNDSSPTICSSETSCTTQGDGCCDTDPITQPADFSTCRTGTNPCTGTPYNNNTEHNFMNYTNCFTLFTPDQKARLLTAANTLYRLGLTESPALTPTNIVYPFINPVASCTPTTSAAGLSNYFAGILAVHIGSKNLYSLPAKDDEGYLNEANNCLRTLQLIPGNNYSIAIEVLDVNYHQLKAWIDYNNNGVFDAAELIYFNPAFDAAATPVVYGSFIVPSSGIATNMVLRLRVIDDLNNITSSCFNPQYGQAEDYPVYIPQLSALPVSIVSFSGQLQNEIIGLKWTTAQENDLKDFVLEKSNDGTEYHRIGVIKANNDKTGSSYAFTDQFPNEVNYYRLVMNDANGNSTMSKVIIITKDGTDQNIRISPNPFTDYIEIETTKAEKHLQLQLVNLSGGTVEQKEIFNAPYRVRWQVRQGLPTGVYILKVITSEGVHAYKIVKK